MLMNDVQNRVRACVRMRARTRVCVYVWRSTAP
jgi:hypothetical protein